MFIKMSVGGYEFVAPTNDILLIQSLDKIRRQIDGNQLDEALREVDRAWRTLPKHRQVIAPIYGRLLVREGKNYGAAINFLVHSLHDDPRPDLEADVIRALLQSGQVEAAQARLVAALLKYVTPRTGALAECARQVVANPAASFRGWLGLNPQMQLRAELRTDSDRVRFVLEAEDQTMLETCDSAINRHGIASAEFAVPAHCDSAGSRVRANGQDLLGGERLLATPFEIDGRATEKRGVISGWARLAWNPRMSPTLRISDRQGRKQRVKGIEPLPCSRWGFRFNLRESGLTDGDFRIAVQLPDNTWQPLPDSPLFSESAARASLRRIMPASSRQSVDHLGGRGQVPRRPAVDVIIPVYKDRERTLACIQSVCETAGTSAASIIVVDDATPDPALAQDLDALAASGRIVLLRNQVNLGFPASVNRAMAQHDDHDAVLINSDVVVFHDWLDRLSEAAYSSPRIATVTPLADDESLVGYSTGKDDSERVAAAQAFDSFAAQTHPRATIDLPVGVGFCMYIRRQCWREIGGFDAVVFDQGYGEEADFCMRARQSNWRNVLAANVFVHHAGGGSFGSRRAALLDRSYRLLNVRHPGYSDFVYTYETQNPLLPFKRNLDAERLRSLNCEFVLLVTLGLSGGVERYVAERCRRIRAEGRIPLVLRPLKLDPEACMLRCEELHLEHFSFQVPRELPELRDLLKSLKIAAIELNHFLGLDARLVDMVRGLGITYDAYLHDYSWICPRITLMDGSRSYCGEPAVTVCERCIAVNGSELKETISVRALRRRSARWLAEADRVIAPCEDTADRFRRYVPNVSIDVIPHETFVLAAAKPERPTDASAMRIALVGAIGKNKGYDVLLACARDAARRNLNLEFAVIGYTENDARLIRTGKVFITGKYAESEFRPLLDRQHPHAFFFPSVWPETWCYALTHAIRSGLPVVAFGLGAIAERLNNEETGTLLPLGTPARSINDYFVGLSE